MLIKYVGLKPREDAFHYLTGIVWGPEGVMQAEVKTEHAAVMLKHPDVFALAQSGASISLQKPAPTPAPTPGPTPAPSTAPAPAGSTLSVGGVIGAAPAGKPAGEAVIQLEGQWVVLDAMEADQLRTIAEKMALTVHPNLGAPKLRKAILKASGQ